MTDVHDKAALEKRLWDEIGKARYGMLGLMNQAQHFQPMTAFSEPETGQIWFFTRDDTDLARAVADGDSHAMFIVMAKDQQFQACISGELTAERDQARIDKYWNPVIAAWYPEGKDDPHLTTLRFDLNDAGLWIGEGGTVRFAVEIARANLTHKRPDLGDRASVSFN